MQTTKGYLHLAGTVFPDDAANLERRMMGYQVTVPSRRKRLRQALLARASACWKVRRWEPGAAR